MYLQILSVEWSPFSLSVFASAGADRRAMIWDFSKCGQTV